jgi:hypothetical protein
MNFLHDCYPEKYPLLPEKKKQEIQGKSPKVPVAEEAKKNTENSLENVMTKVKNVLKQHQIRIEEYFLDYDPLRKGDVPINKFKGCLDNFK